MSNELKQDSDDEADAIVGTGNQNSSSMSSVDISMYSRGAASRPSLSNTSILTGAMSARKNNNNSHSLSISGISEISSFHIDT